MNQDLSINQAMVARHLEAENRHHMADTLATLHEDCLFEDVTLGQSYRGLQGARDYYSTWWKAFSVTVSGVARHWTVDGNLIAETRYLGSHVGPFYGLAPTGKQIELRLAVVIRFRDGLLSGERFYYDLSSLLRQLGASSLPSLIQATQT